jgi:hypothetical protein
VTVRIGADPDLLPRRRNDELADALHHLGLVDTPALLVEVLEAAPATAADDAWTGAIDSSEAGHGCEVFPRDRVA